MRQLHCVKKGFYPAHAPAKALSPVLSKLRDNRRLEVALPSVEFGVDLDSLTDLVLDTCPGVISVSAELVSEKTHNQENVDTIRTDRTDLFQTWESHVQGTGAWLAALVRLQVLPSFQINNLEQLLHSAYPALPFTITEPERRTTDDTEEDWILKVQQSWPPQRIGNLTVYFPWHNRSNSADYEAKVVVEDASASKSWRTPKVELVLEGGAAFGTGDHPTTRMCVNWLSRIFQQNKCIETTGQRAEKWSLLDYGCGSAILALAGLRFGAATATGVDIDVDSLHSAQRNCQLNNLHVDLYLTDPDDTETFEELRGERLLKPTAVEKTSTSLLADKFDVTVANIIAPVLIPLAPKLAASTKPGGKVALSGVLAFQAETVIAAYKPYFDDVCVEDVEGVPKQNRKRLVAEIRTFKAMYDGKVESEEEYKDGIEIGNVATKALKTDRVKNHFEAPSQKRHFYHKLKSFVNSSHRASGAHAIEDEDVVAERTKSFTYSIGLTAHEAELRLQKFGKNELPEIKIPK
eukprot:gene16852-19206_t